MSALTVRGLCGILELLRLIARVLFNIVQSCYNFIDPFGFAHSCNSLDNWKLNGSFALTCGSGATKDHYD